MDREASRRDATRARTRGSAQSAPGNDAPETSGEPAAHPGVHLVKRKMLHTSPLPFPSAPPADEQVVALRRRLRWLAVGRAVFVGLLFGVSLAVNLSATEHTGADPAFRELYLAGGLVVAASIPFLWATARLRSLRALEILGLIEFFGDVLFASVIVAETGGTDSVFTFSFALVTIVAAAVLYRRGAAVTAAACSVALVAMAAGELGVHPFDALLPNPANLPVVWAPWRHLPADQLFRTRVYNVGVNLFAFLSVGFLASHLAEQARRSGEEQRRVRSRLDELEALHRDIVSSIMQGLLTVDEEGRITFFNPAFEEMTGLAQASVLLRPLDAVFPRSARAMRSAAASTRYPVAIEVTEQVNGRMRALRWHVSPLRDSVGELRGRVLFAEDVTVVREMERRLQRAERLAAIGELAARIAHEIRNPLAAISGSVQLLRQHASANDERTQRLMNVVLREVDSLNEWISDFLDYSRTRQLQREPTDIVELVRGVIEAYNQESAQAPAVLVASSVPPDCMASVDRARLRQVVWNLLRNAREAMQGRPGPVEVSVSRRAVQGKPHVIIEVTDRGPGIAPELRDRIFEPFYTTKERGTGLGLATAHRVVEQHHGFIEVNTRPGDGSTFLVYLPVDA